MSSPHDNQSRKAPSPSDPFETYEEAEEYLNSFIDYERMAKSAPRPEDLFGLARIQRLLGRVGNPHVALRGIHLAGTKGKGSSAVYAEALLRAHGLKTGLFTSPHLVEKEERIQVSAEMIDKEAFREWLSRLRPTLTELAGCDQAPTFFDILTAVAFLHFRACGVEAAVLEVGLGGRLDSTNVFLPDVCIITRLGLDHTERLGHTLDRIAAEKAGIVKEGTPVVAHPQEPEARKVLERKCLEARAPLHWIGEQIRIEEPSPERARFFAVRTARQRYPRLSLAALGRHQRVNAAGALAAAEIFLEQRQGRLLDPERVRATLLRTRPPGRIEVLSKAPLLVVDGAHNPLSMEVLLAAVTEELRFADLHVVFACSRDKDVHGMLALLADRARRWTLTTFDFPRLEAPEVVAECLKGIQPAADVRITRDPDSALDDAYRRSGPHDCLLCCGSFYLAGEILKRWRKKAGHE